MNLSQTEIKNRAHQFTIDFADAVKENAESQLFLNAFFKIFGVDSRRIGKFERAVKTDNSRSTKRIDHLWPGKLLIEMKSTGQNLDKAYQQGFNYFKGLKDEDLPRFVMVCDLNDFRLYDLNKDKDYRFTLDQLVDNLHLFDFMQDKELIDVEQYELNEKAAYLLGNLHDALEASGYQGHQLQIFMVRILFILFAEDTGVFNQNQFTLYLKRFTDESGLDTDMHLHKLFQILDKPESERNLNLSEELNAFPYVNGHLFEERIDLPSFNQSMREQLIECCHFNWKDISPAIFGSLFQSIMDKTLRRNLGAHYTSEANILKVIEPLFLNDLNAEFERINKLKQLKTRDRQFIELMNQIRSLKLLDPACGCGNFLIISYRELRRLELKIMQAQLQSDQQAHFAIDIEPQISLNNFYGIEIDEWPARIAEVAMWLTQQQMNREFAKSFGREPDLLPLKQHANIHHANALTQDWAEIIAAQQLDYIIGNPPFVGKQYRTPEQVKSMEIAFDSIKKHKNLDFVAAWFYKSAIFARNTKIKIALVSTNSITMGEQVAILWQPILDMGYKINFAHRTFQWHNDAKGKAAVHCIIVGFGLQDSATKTIFDYPDVRSEALPIKAEAINPYLVDAIDKIIANRAKPICSVPEMVFGSMPNDGGCLLLNAEEKQALINSNPELEHWIKPALGAREYINSIQRYCLWLADSSAKQRRDLMQIPEVKRRIEGVFQMRSTSNRASTKKLAEAPWLFGEIRHPKQGTYILVPRVSSERREYVPMGFFDQNTVVTDAALIIPNASLYEFGVLTSQMHMDWMRTVAGRLKSDYRYSIKLVYNNFPWPQATDAQKAQIEQLAQAILDARQQEVDKDASTSLADLYDPDLMPPELRKAHNAMDKAVDKLYRDKPFSSPLARVKHLFELYSQLTS
ncbi:DNA methyltransferase [Kangiella sp. TOML190]|uniref:class I SAM-dependent DNA methyltransferase n=1 Tax=Kangiella sp. TOML190 TaxID=2931351 RepID=UPI00203A521F|nr:DNA methyltransferase [Kangiella sp. TOML190]